MARLAFYDLDGTLVSGNVVERYAFFVRHLPSKLRAILKFSKLLASLPLYVGLDFYSRGVFNRVFFRAYRGMDEEWLRSMEAALFQRVILPSLYPGAKPLVDSDRAAGFHPVLVTGELDFAVAPLADYFGFEAVVANSLIFKDGAATGEVAQPLVAGREKVGAILRLCRERGAAPSDCKAYSDSFSDAPMLESVGYPAAVNPDRRLRRVAAQRGWPILDLKGNHHVRTG
jgi:HAD superfamily hydrolase (TIGR01490 family)